VDESPGNYWPCLDNAVTLYLGRSGPSPVAHTMADPPDTSPADVVQVRRGAYGTGNCTQLATLTTNSTWPLVRPLRQAFAVMYSGTVTSEVRNQVNAWLVAVQNGPAAWALAAQLLTPAMVGGQVTKWSHWLG